MQNNSEKHHRKSIRLKGYDYAQEGLYFITLCCHNHFCMFGEIENETMNINEKGKIAETELLKTAEIRQNVYIDSYIIMPNHIHFIISIQKNVSENIEIETEDSKTLISPSQTIGAIIRGYKAAVTKQINLFEKTTQQQIWQRNYYEHIIRNMDSYIKIRDYIENNPKNWLTDSLNS